MTPLTLLKADTEELLRELDAQLREMQDTVKLHSHHRFYAQDMTPAEMMRLKAIAEQLAICIQIVGVKR